MSIDTPTRSRRARRAPAEPTVLGMPLRRAVHRVSDLPATPPVWRETAAAGLATGQLVWLVHHDGREHVLVTNPGVTVAGSPA